MPQTLISGSTIPVSFSPTSVPYDVLINVLPPVPTFGPSIVNLRHTVQINPIEIPLFDVITQAINEKIGTRIQDFFDQDRHLKTLLNFGNDYQSLITNWAYVPAASPTTIGDVYVKLYRPLPASIQISTPVFITKEKSYPVIDKIYVTRAPDIPILEYLRPPNRSISVTGQQGNTVDKVTLSGLLGSGAFNPVAPTDTVMQQWYTTDLAGAELNVDYSDFRNFVFFGSAAKRLEAFRNKLTLLEHYNSVIAQNSASIVTIANQASMIDLTTDSMSLDSSTWTKVGASVTGNLAIAPDGTATADKITEDTGSSSGGQHMVYQLITDSYAGNVTITGYVSASLTDRYRGQFYADVGGAHRMGVTFDLSSASISNATLGSGSIATSSIAPAGGGWYKLSVTGRPHPTASAISVITRLYSGSTGVSNYTGSGVASQYWWNVKMQAQGTPTYSTYTSPAIYYPAYEVASQRQDLLRSFDGYEQFLYYDSGSQYSSSFAVDYDDDDEIAYYVDATWPKVNGSVVTVASASSWYNSIVAIAEKYDAQNKNRFTNNIPEYITLDDDSVDYLTFFDLVGHMFDTVKLYIDNMTTIYDRGNSATDGLSMDLVWDVANGLGIDVPNQYTLQTLYNYAIGNVSGSTTTVYREAAAETWKRFLHNHIFLMKSKGTKTGLLSLLNTYGILGTSLRVRESSTPSFFYPSASYEVKEENTYALYVSSSTRLDFTLNIAPFVGSANTVQFRFAPSIAFMSSSAQQTRLFGQTQANEYPNNQLLVNIHKSGSLYRLELVSGSILILSSSYNKWVAEEFYNVGITAQSGRGSAMYFSKVADDATFDISNTCTSPSESYWNAGSLSIGGTTFAATTASFDGYIDEVRFVGEYLTQTLFDAWSKTPGSYFGSDYTMASASLRLRHSFNIPVPVSGTTVPIKNEAPSAVTGSTFFPVTSSLFNFPYIATYPYNTRIFTRHIVLPSPNAGGSVYDSNKIIVNDPPTLVYISGSTVPVLSKNTSIVSPKTLLETDTKANNNIGLYVSITDSINDSIYRSMGPIDYHQQIDPVDLYSSSYSSLDALNNFYWSHYAYSYNINYYLTYVKNLFNAVFEQAEQMIPAKAKLLAGVVIEPHALERKRVPLTPVKREDDEILNMVATPATYQPTNVLGETLDYSTEIDRIEVGGVVSDIVDEVATLDTTENIMATAQDTDLSVTIGAVQQVSINAQDLDNISHVNISSVMDTARFYVNSYYSGALYVEPIYGPYSDPELDIGAGTYFTDVSGLIGTTEITYIRNAIYNNLLHWNSGTTYFKADMVSYPRTYNGDLNILSTTYKNFVISNPNGWLTQSVVYSTVNNFTDISSNTVLEYNNNTLLNYIRTNSTTSPLFIFMAPASSSAYIVASPNRFVNYGYLFKADPLADGMPASKQFTIVTTIYNGKPIPDTMLARVDTINLNQQTCIGYETAYTSSVAIFNRNANVINLSNNLFLLYGIFWVSSSNLTSAFETCSMQIQVNSVSSSYLGGAFITNQLISEDNILSMVDPAPTNWYYSKINNFISNQPPDIDTAHWGKVPYVSTTKNVLKKAVIVSGNLSLVDPNNVPTGAAVVRGYLPQHWRFFRPNYAAFIRSRYSGCLQTSATTIDGGAPVEILQSLDTSLTVQPSVPVIPTNNATGPILGTS